MKPNILIIITDQQNIDAISAYRKHFKDKAWHCHWIKTPNLDRIVRGGYSFMESYSTNPVSCPARASIFTGRYSIETGVIHNNIGIDATIPNMGEWFEKHSNYNRIYCGKWHAGGAWNYPEVDGARKIPGFDTLPTGASNTGDINDYQVSGALSGFIRNYNDEKPFLAVAGFLNPHDICYWIPVLNGKDLVPTNDRFNLGDNRPPLPPNFEVKFNEIIPKDQISRTEDEWRNYLYDYQRMVEKFDVDLGRLLSAVDSRSDETLIVFTSDHGEGAARHKRVQKWHPYDEAMKVPLVFYLPKTVKRNKFDTTNIVSGIDIMPTVCDYAGIPMPPNSAGRSLRNIIEGKNETRVFDTAFAEFQYTGRIVRHGDYKLVKMYEYSKNTEKPFVRADNGEPSQFERGAKPGTYKEKPIKLLFNIAADPWETIDLFGKTEYKAIAEKCEQLLFEEWESKVVPGVHFDR